ncbi:MAG: tetratricopeptide repeat protein, partial [Spirochaetales bacterium]|nr:tetratricopeptide repeat protein [Spirochaetales bacterium]
SDPGRIRPTQVLRVENLGIIPRFSPIVTQGIIEPEKLLVSLRFAHRERSDAWFTWSVLINHLISMNELDEAKKTGTAATGQFPLNPNLWLDLARVMQFTFDTEGEIEALEKAREINPSLSEASQRLSQLYERKGELKKAREIMENACAATPLNAINFGFLAEILFIMGEHKEALYKLRRALLLYPDYRWAWHTLWEWASRLNETSFFMDLAKQLVEQREGDPLVWTYLAESHFITGNPAKALTAIDKAIELDPYHVPAYDLRAQHYTYCGNFEKALESLIPPGMETIPAPLLIRKAWVEARRGCKKEAVIILKEVLGKAPENEYGWSLLCAYLFDLNDTGQLEKTALKMAQLFPLNTYSYEYLGMIYLERGCKNRAKELFQKAFAIVPAHTMAGRELFELELKSGNTDNAGKILNTMIQQAGKDNCYLLSCQARLSIIQKEYGYAEQIFRYICAHHMDDPWPLTSITDAFDAAGLSRMVYKIANKVIRLNEYRVDVNKHIGPVWVKHNAEQNRWFYFIRLKKVYNYTGTPTIAAYIIKLSEAVKKSLAAPSLFSSLKYKILLKRIYSRFPATPKQHTQACLLLGESLLLCGLINPAIDVLRLWSNHNIHNTHTITIACNYITTLFIKGKNSSAHQVIQHLNTKHENKEFTTGPGREIFSLWELLHAFISKTPNTGKSGLGKYNYDNLSCQQRIVYNCIHFLQKKQEYENTLRKKQVIIQYLNDFPDKVYMFHILKYLLKHI